MRKRLFPVILSMVLLAACGGGRGYDALMHEADSLLTAGEVTSAYTLLAEADSQKTAWSRRQQMAYELLKAQAQNQAYVDFQTDSVMREVARYYDRHGTHNERLKAHYLLGCTYRDLHEAPRALECYHDAIICADTLQADCDYYTLGCVYSQMAELYHQQILFSQEIESHQQSRHFALLAQDTLNAIYEYKQNAAAYILLNKRDSAEQILLHAKELYLQHGYLREWAMASTPLMAIYLRQDGRLNKVKELMDFYEAESGLFDERSELPVSRRIYFRYKGQYYEQRGLLDSAEYCYRKIYHPLLDYTQKDAMYHGLLSVYMQKNQVDSIVKYALLYCQANDSSLVKKDRNLMAQMTASYNYAHFKEQASKQREKAANARLWMIIFLVLTFFLLFFSMGVWQWNKERRLKKQKELEEARKELKDAEYRYTNEIRTLKLLEAKHYNVIELVQLQLKNSKGETEKYRAQFEETQQHLNQLNAIHEEAIRYHQAEVERLKMKINQLNHVAIMKEDIKKGIDFKVSDIAQKIQHMAEKSKFEIQEEDLYSLTLEFSYHYPDLLSDLQKMASASDLTIPVCILLVLGIRESDIANFLHCGKSTISNVKSEINLAFFNEKSSRSLYRNLARQYGIIS